MIRIHRCTGDLISEAERKHDSNVPRVAFDLDWEGEKDKQEIPGDAEYRGSSPSILEQQSSQCVNRTPNKDNRQENPVREVQSSWEAAFWLIHSHQQRINCREKKREQTLLYSYEGNFICRGWAHVSICLNCITPV